MSTKKALMALEPSAFWGMLVFGHKRFAVGALVHGGVCLMCSHCDAVERAIIFGGAKVCTLFYGAFDAFVCFTFHSNSLLKIFCFKTEPAFYRSLTKN